MTEINKFINGSHKKDDKHNSYNSGLKLVLKIGMFLTVGLILVSICGVVALYVNDHTEHYKYTQVPSGAYYLTDKNINHINESNLKVSINSDKLNICGSNNEIIINTNITHINIVGVDNVVFILPESTPTISDNGNNNKIINQEF